MTRLNLMLPPVAQAIVIALLIYFSSFVFPIMPIGFFVKVATLFLSLVLAAYVGISGIITFRRAQTTLNPMSPDSATSLVTHGIYKYSRNPMYLGLAILLSGEALFLASPVSLAFVVLFIAYMNRFQIIPEERALKALFGEVFTQYQQQTRRWI